MSLLHAVIVELVRRNEVVLTCHQLGVYLTCYVRDADHTVQELAQELNVSRFIIRRTLDKLCEMKLVRRRMETNGRSSIVERTETGYALLDDIARIAADVLRSIETEMRPIAVVSSIEMGTHPIAVD